ncbi:MAG: ABC transporter ATP-binding protein [Thermodesulfobacteriota bacterium]
MIKINDVSKCFGSLRALDGVSTSVERGEAVALLGPNGAGKSTLIKCLLGVLDFTGEIIVDGLGVRDNSKLTKALMGYVPQEPAFYDMTVLELVGFFGSLRNVKKERIMEAIELTGLAEHAGKHCSALSGGMKQRLSFAIAMLSDAPILLLDEPTSNLDAFVRTDFLRLIRDFKENGKTILFSSHRLDEVEFLADRVVVMNSGRVVLECSPHDLTKQIEHKTRIHLEIPSSSLPAADSVIREFGYEAVTLNCGDLIVETSVENKMGLLSALIRRNVPVTDFKVEEISMEELMLALVSERGNDGH